MALPLSDNPKNKLSLKRYKGLTNLMVMLFLVSVFLLSVTLAHILKGHTYNNVLLQQADMILETMSSVQAYTSNEIQPSLANQVDHQFFPESVPSYSAQQVFEQLRQNPKYGDFFYKQAVLNPTNLRDKADAFEAMIIEKYRSGEISSEAPSKGTLSTEKEHLFYEAKAIDVYKPSCLKCHSTPDVAPDSMLQHYGRDNGFGWQLNEIVGVQIVYLPLNILHSSNRVLLWKIMAVVVTTLGLILLGLHRWIKPT